MHGGGKRVVRGLRHVDVIIGMDRLLRSQHAARDLDGAVRDDFVDVHVGLRAAARLPDAQRELIIPLALNHLVGGLHNQLRLLCRELAQVQIYERTRLLQNSECPYQLGRHGVAANVEVEQRALRLRAPVHIRRDFNLPHAVGFHARAGHGFCGGRHRTTASKDEVTEKYSADVRAACARKHTLV